MLIIAEAASKITDTEKGGEDQGGGVQLAAVVAGAGQGAQLRLRLSSWRRGSHRSGRVS